MKLSKYYYKYLGVKKLPRKRKKAFKKEVERFVEFHDAINDVIIEYVDPNPHLDSSKEIELLSEGRISLQTEEMTMDEISKLMGLPKECFGKQEPLIKR